MNLSGCPRTPPELSSVFDQLRFSGLIAMAVGHFALVLFVKLYYRLKVVVLMMSTHKLLQKGAENMEHQFRHYQKSSWRYFWNFIYFIIYIFVFSLTSSVHLSGQNYSRGVGIYPGNVKEDFSPAIKLDKTTYRNLALRRPAYHSSSYDYNLTAQLVTDGIKDTRLPGWISVSTSIQGTLKRHEREWFLDRQIMTSVTLDSSHGWVLLEIGGGSELPVVDSVNVSGGLRVNNQSAQGWKYIFSGSIDGNSWSELGTEKGEGLPGDSLPRNFRWFFPANFRVFNKVFHLSIPVAYRFYRVEFNAPNALNWNVGEITFFNKKTRLNIGGPYHFTSAWMSGGHQVEWVYVDLGANCSLDRIMLYWICRPSDGSIQISNDATNWKDILRLPENPELQDDLKLDQSITGRYVRVLIQKMTSPERCILSEMEVFGQGGPIAVPGSPPPVRKDGRMDLAGGKWRIQRESLVNSSGEALSNIGFPDNDWVVATVPATVLVSYLNAGALPDPNYADNQLMISESFFWADFWYRTEFMAPTSYKGKRIFLNFDGINWKAEIFLNGENLGRIEGGFMRGLFDVTENLLPGQMNALAVRIEKNTTPGYAKEQTKLSPGANGGELGADNPTYHASIGWDWMPTIRGRNTGIWNDVYLTVSGPVTIVNPFITTDLPLPDTTTADVSIEVTLQNHLTQHVSGFLRGTLGGILFEKSLTLSAMEKKLVRLDPTSHPVLRLKNPKLWWPNGYGRPHLYPVELWFETADKSISDKKSFQTGIREMTYSEEGEILKIWVNGRRFIGRGGNWGFPESMLRYRSREYDTAVHLHQDMNFTMIRNWVGQTADDEFFEACDRYGIMIWQDFWLANPVDGPNPNDEALFLRNAKDFVWRIRNHPSIALYCGRNEGNPPEILDKGLRTIINEIHPNIHYISNSAFGVVSGGGPYRAMPVKFYFEGRATSKLHSEMGMPNIVSFESLQQMIPDSALWPPGRMWGIHDFCLEGAQGGASFIEQMDKSFGTIDNAKDWISLAQWINYQGYRAMFEAQSKYRMGLLLWMSHPAWPSMVWQTYDYYFEPTAAYFGCKKASEPLHIQWNPLSDSIEVVNYHVRDVSGLLAAVEIFNLDGTLKWEKKLKLDCPEDETVACFKLEYPDGLSDVHFLRLKLMKGNKLISENFYWRGLVENDFKAVRELPKVILKLATQMELKNDVWHLTTTVINPSPHPALMVRLKVVREKSRDRILPVYYRDNYIFLMPGEQRIIQMKFANADTRAEKPLVVIEGFNID